MAHCTWALGRVPGNHASHTGVFTGVKKTEGSRRHAERHCFGKRDDVGLEVSVTCIASQVAGARTSFCETTCLLQVSSVRTSFCAATVLRGDDNIVASLLERCGAEDAMGVTGGAARLPPNAVQCISCLLRILGLLLVK